MKVSAVVVSHGHATELARSLPALVPQVDETIVIANLPGSVDAVPEGVRVLENRRPLSLAANVNLGIAATEGRVRPHRQPGRGSRAGRGRRARRLCRCASAAAGSPARGCAGRTGRGSRHAGAFRRSAARSCAVRRSVACGGHTRGSATTTSSTNARPSPRRPTGCSARSCSCAARCWIEIGGWDAGFRHYCEDIDLCYRAAQAGWERWYVPDAVVTHDYAAVIDRSFLSRHTLWHARGMARFVRKHPERLLAL